MLFTLKRDNKNVSQNAPGRHSARLRLPALGQILITKMRATKSKHPKIATTKTVASNDHNLQVRPKSSDKERSQH